MTLSHIFCVFFFVRWTRPPPPQNFICDFVKPNNLSYQSRFFNSTIPRMDPTCVCRRRFFSRLSLSPSFSRRNPSRHASCIIIIIITYRLPTPFSKHTTDLSFPRRATTISSRTRKTRKPARRRTRKRRRCTSRARNREVRRRRRPEYSARRASGKGEFYSDFERKRDVGCTLSFFLSFFRLCAPGAKTRGLPDVLIILSFSLSFSLSL